MVDVNIFGTFPKESLKLCLFSLVTRGGGGFSSKKKSILELKKIKIRNEPYFFDFNYVGQKKILKQLVLFRS